MTPDRILVVEDDPEITAILQKGLRAEGYAVDVAALADEAEGLLAAGVHRLVILDRMLPDAEGAAFCRRLRARGTQSMILMLTARDALADKLEGLRSGADDYVTKPFAFEELLLRIEALLRRAPDPAGAPTDATTGKIVSGDLRLDLDRMEAWRGDRALGLTATEFALLRHLAENAGRVISRADLLKAVWDYDFDPHTNIVEVYIAYLRRKVDQRTEQRLIVTHRGFGYSLSVEGFVEQGARRDGPESDGR
jgi:DNA-binding response OmpR family regulator